MWRSLVAAVLATVLAGNGPGGPAEQALRHYLASQRDYLATVRKDAQLAGEVAPAMAIIAGMPPDAINRIDALGYPLLVAADNERANRAQWATVGTDWTRYSLPDGCCRTPYESHVRLRVASRRQCDETVFRTEDGAIERTGRATQPGIPPGIGIVPIGVDEYRGTLLTATGARLPVTWARSWSGERGDPRMQDPIGLRRHRFTLRRLAGARYWTVSAWSGAGKGEGGPSWADRAGCIAATSLARA